MAQRPAAEALKRVQDRAEAAGYGLLIHDAYRPWRITKMMWDETQPAQREFVADPATGSRHNRGCAIDLTLYDLKTGRPVEMPSRYDEFSKLMWGVDRAQDVTTSAKLQAVFGTTAAIQPGRVYGSVEAGTARMLQTPATTHPGDHISPAAIGHALEPQAMLARRNDDAARLRDQREAVEVVEIEAARPAIRVAIDRDREVCRRARRHVLRESGGHRDEGGQGGAEEAKQVYGTHQLGCTVW